MRIFVLRGFAKFQRRERIAAATLKKAVAELERGVIDADLGGGLIKQRVSREGQGKRGGYRVLLVFREGERVVFLFGFAKNERANIDDDELAKLRVQGRALLALNEEAIEALIADDELMEV
jgi:hypothetical protein